jgi:hypothetical protein
MPDLVFPPEVILDADRTGVFLCSPTPSGSRTT